MSRITFLALFAFVSQFSATAADLPPFDFVYERDQSVPLVNVGISFRKGSTADPQTLGGLTYLMTEMLLKGTKLRTKNQLELKMDELGSTIGMDVRAEFIVVRGSVLSANLAPFLDLLSEIVLTPSFPDREFIKLKQKTLSQIIAMKANDNSLARHHFNRFLFGDHPYGRSTVGTTSSLGRIRREHLVQHHREILSGDDMIVAGSGDAEAAVIYEWAKKMQQALPRESRAVSVPPPPKATKPRLLVIDKADRTQAPLIAGHTGISFKDPDFFPLYLGNYAFGGPSFSARLSQEIRVKRGWSYGTGSRFQYGSVNREWSYTFSPANRDAPPALQLSLQMVRDLRDKGLTEKEFTFTRESIVNSAGFMYNTPDKRVENTLIERVFRLPPGFFRSYETETRKLTLEQVNQSLRRFLKPENIVVTTVGSAKELSKPLADALGIPESEVVVNPFTAE
jgi:zinc protease